LGSCVINYNSASFQSANFLAQNVPIVQKKVYGFAQEAIEYIHTLIEIVGEEASVRKDLEAIWCVSYIFGFLHGYRRMYSTAVNEICEWASEDVVRSLFSLPLLDSELP
jgi:hypothetical protein